MLMTMFSCNKPDVVYPPFDGSKKLVEVQHVYRDEQNPDLILAQDVFTIHYNGQGKVSECFEGDRLLYRCIYDGNVLTRVETDFNLESPSTVYEVSYTDGKVNAATYIFESNFSITMYYKYLSENEFTRFDTTEFEADDFVYNMVHFREERVETLQINPFDTVSSTENFMYSTVPSFISVFGLPVLPIHQLYRPIGFDGIPPEIVLIATYLPSAVEGPIFGINEITRTFEYEFSDGLVRKININSLITDMQYEVVLIWK